MKRELQGRVEALREKYRNQPNLEFERVASPYTSSLAATERRYGANLDANNHGESFLAFFRAHLAKGGLYLLDGPEAAPSPLYHPVLSFTGQPPSVTLLLRPLS